MIEEKKKEKEKSKTTPEQRFELAKKAFEKNGKIEHRVYKYNDIQNKQ